MYGNFRPATLDEYVKWLKGYLKNGGQPTHYYDYPFERNDMLYVSGRFGLDDECGVNSKHIIVAEDGRLDLRRSDFGQNVLLHMTGFASQDSDGRPSSYVPVYNDRVILSIPRMDSVIQAW